MKRIAKRSLPVVMAVALLAMGCALTSCGGSKRTSNGREVMYERHQTNKGSRVNSNIKVRGTNKQNRHTTRTY